MGGMGMGGNMGMGMSGGMGMGGSMGMGMVGGMGMDLLDMAGGCGGGGMGSGCRGLFAGLPTTLGGGGGSGFAGYSTALGESGGSFVGNSTSPGGAPLTQPLAAAVAPPISHASPSATTPAELMKKPNADHSAIQDYTRIPAEMDKRFEMLDEDNALHPTIITPADRWTKRSQRSLLASRVTATLESNDLKREKDAAFDLLDALTKSGALPVQHASLHVLLAATHCFDKTVLETAVQDNVSPIEKVERSTLIMGSIVHGKPAVALIRDSHRERLQISSPMLFLEDGGA